MSWNNDGAGLVRAGIQEPTTRTLKVLVQELVDLMSVPLSRSHVDNDGQMGASMDPEPSRMSAEQR